MIITIDGPSASGKSTVAQALAHKLNMYYVSSGLLFRTLAYFLIKNFQHTPTTVSNATQKEINDFHHRCVYLFNKTGVHIFLDDDEVTSILKKSDLDVGASIIATHPEAREAILIFQRTLAQHHSTIIEGRDCGSIVFPHAEVKIFLTASLEVRAQRWQHVQALLGNSISLEQALTSIAARDKRDTERTLDPLVIPDNAHIIDNSLLTLPDTINVIINIIKEKQLYHS